MDRELKSSLPFFFLGRGAGRRGVVGIHFLYISGLCEKDGRYYLWLTKKQLGSKSHFFFLHM